MSDFTRAVESVSKLQKSFLLAGPSQTASITARFLSLIGRPGWDNWLIWFALSAGVAVVDVSKEVCAVHQNHNYSYHPEGERGVWQGDEAQENFRLLEKGSKFRTLDSAVYVLQSGQLRRNSARWLVLRGRYLREWLYSAWFAALTYTASAP